MTSIYEALGAQNVRLIAQYFYEEVATNDLLKSMYPKALAPAEDRLWLFLQQVFGGPTTYSEQRGHPRLRRRHFPYPIDEAARAAWMGCMHRALDRVEMLPEVREQLNQYFEQAAIHMMNR